jgi:hypothetical protein
MTVSSEAERVSNPTSYQGINLNGLALRSPGLAARGYLVKTATIFQPNATDLK